MAFELTNSSSYNVENVLRQNICNSDYYNNTCLALQSWQDVVDEIYDSVEHVEPWMSGNARGPSSAFCLLHRLFTLKLSVREVRALLDHKDSPYIRAVGFLFLRYVCDPKKLWQWCSTYMQDEQEFSPSPGGKMVTMGEFVRDVLLEQYYFETIFPRIPKPVMDAIIEELKAMRLPTTAKGNAGAGGADRRGVDDGNKRPASVKASLSVAMGQRAPNRAGGREDRAMGTMNKQAGARPPLPRSPLPAERARSRSPLPPSNLQRSDRDGRDRGRDESGDRGPVRRDDDRDRYRREADRPRGGDRDRASDRDRDRASDRDRDRAGDRDRDRGRDSRSDYDRGRSRDDGGRRDRDGGRETERDRSSKGRDYERGSRERSRDRERVRSRSRERNGGGGGRDARDVFRESAKEVARDTNPDAVRSKYL